MTNQYQSPTTSEVPYISIVKHSKGYTATLRYKDGKRDKMIAETSLRALDRLVDKEVMGNGN